eukprot:m.99849 g.99849  ORF g.99849 m.99849 type:complete len:73 (-) comp12546_c0_seq2:2071-2289(-)
MCLNVGFLLSLFRYLQFKGKNGYQNSVDICNSLEPHDTSSSALRLLQQQQALVDGAVAVLWQRCDKPLPCSG